MNYSKQRAISEKIVSSKEGTSDVIKLIKDSKILDISARVNLSHASSENLTMKLVGPNGKSVVLHKKEKVKGKFLVKSYGAKELKKFVGLKSKGNWTINVSDTGKGKTGYLNSWTLNMKFADSPKSETFIPDKAAKSLISKHHCHEAGKIKSMKCNVNIAHDFVGDLTLSLVSPSGTEQVLQKRIGAGKKNLKKTFTKKDLEKFNGESAKGAWSIKVNDSLPKDTGRLINWGLDIVLM